MRNDQAVKILKAQRATIDALLAMVDGPGGPKPALVFVRDRLAREADDTLPGAGTDGGSRPKGSHSDPTAGLALDNGPKRAAAQSGDTLAELDAAIFDAGLKLARALEIVNARKITRHHEPRQNPGCENCRRVTLHNGNPHPEAWQEVKARGLCGWCYRWTHGNGPDRPGLGELPLELVAWHLDHLGSEPPRTMLRDLMPEQWKAREETRRRNAERDTFHDAPREEFTRDLHAVTTAPESDV